MTHADTAPDHRRTILATLTAGLLLTGCMAGSEDPSGITDAGTPPTQPPTPAPDTTEPSTPAPTTTAPTTEPAPVTDLAASCELVVEDTTMVVSHPAGWAAAEDCSAFDPEAVPEDSDAFAVGLTARPDAYPTTVPSPDEVRDVQLAVVDGHQAIRTVEPTELGPADTSVVWRVDLDPGVDETGGTLLASAPNTGLMVPAVLDQMMAELQIQTEPEPGVTADPPQGTIVARSEGGGLAYTVVATDDGCLQLFGGSVAAEPADSDCPTPGPSATADAAVSTARLVLGDDVELVAGFAGSSVTAVRPDDGGPAVRTTHTPDGRAFAFRADAAAVDAALLAGDGSTIGTAGSL